jgi:CPA1 family monovalent cation:H+ antiporter
MTGLQSIVSILIVLTAAFAYVNHRFVKLPPVIGIMFLSLLSSLFILAAGRFFPNVLHLPRAFLRSVPFEMILMKLMLSFLLFAGAVHIDIRLLRKEAWSIAALSTIGVLLSTVLVGLFVYGLSVLFSYPIPLIFCFLFGALISPTDPIAVLGILKTAGISKQLETRISGESLFNDGVGVVVFISIMEFATTGGRIVSFGDVATIFLRETGGGLAWGLLLGYVGYRLIRSIDQYQVETIITLALVMGGYLVADRLHVSGLLAMVVAGIIVGNKARQEAMSGISRDYVGKFWELIDEIFNAILFLLIGLELLAIPIKWSVLVIAVCCIPATMAARFIPVLIPVWLLSFWKKFERNISLILTWSGLRGSISIALALSLPPEMYRSVFVTITYVIVIFSILVQGLTIGRVTGRLSTQGRTSDHEDRLAKTP